MIEDRAGGVGNAADEQQDQHARMEVLAQRPDGDDAQPAHAEIEEEASRGQRWKKASFITMPMIARVQEERARPQPSQPPRPMIPIGV